MRITSEHSNRISGLVIKITDINFNKTSIVKKCNNFEIHNFKYLLAKLYQKQKHPIRLLGIGVKLDDNNKTQLELF
jgi:DNA polymerase-4